MQVLENVYRSKALTPARVNPWKVLQKYRQGRPLTSCEQYLVQIAEISPDDTRVEFIRKILLSFRVLKDIARLFYSRDVKIVYKQVLGRKISKHVLPRKAFQDAVLALSDVEYLGCRNVLFDAVDFLRKLTVLDLDDEQVIFYNGVEIVESDLQPHLPKDRHSIEKVIYLLYSTRQKKSSGKTISVGVRSFNNVLVELGFDVATPREICTILEQAQNLGIVKKFEVHLGNEKKLRNITYRIVLA